jgi:acyl-CoA oxidase
LKIKGKSFGPHALIISFRENGNLVKGITIGDMGKKTIGNDLDNAWIEFKSVEVSKECLLQRYCEIIGNEYK